MIFFTSDPHYFHANFLKFRGDDEAPIRPFSCVEEMNQRMVDGWNSVIRDGDKVYCLGDVTFDYSGKFESLWSQLRGSKRLVLGNHDDLKRSGGVLARQFKKIMVWRQFTNVSPGFVCTHIPIHPDHFRKVEFNVHGHLHQNLVQDWRYINVCVEQTNYIPVSFDEIVAEMAKRTPANDDFESERRAA